MSLWLRFSPSLSPAIALADPAAPSAPASSVVIVARDVTTSSHCTTKTILAIGTQNEVTRFAPCSPGTIVSTFKVSLAEAQAHHEQFVRLDQSLSTQDGQIQFQQHVSAVISAVRESARQAMSSAAIVPQISTPCGQTNGIYTYWTPSWDSSTEYLSYTGWLHTSDCQYVYIQKNSIDEQVHHTSGYWEKSTYYNANPWTLIQCPQITSSLRAIYPDENEVPGHYMIQYITSGSNCFPWDPVATVSQGTLN